MTEKRLLEDIVKIQYFIDEIFFYNNFVTIVMFFMYITTVTQNNTCICQ